MYYVYILKSQIASKQMCIRSTNGKSGAGFTLIELAIVLGIVALVSILAIPFIQTFQVSSDLYTDANTLTQTLRRAQQQAVLGQNSSAWGVYFDDSAKKFFLFKSQSYIARDASYDQNFDYPQSFNLATDFGREIYFSGYTGKPSASGTVAFTSNNNEKKIISINSYGRIETSK